MKVGVVGYGVVGSAIARFVARRNEHELVIFDKFIQPNDTAERKAAINLCDLVFLCVPTPAHRGDLGCDLSAVEECVGWITAPLCVRSTVPPGTVDRLSAETGLPIAFCPEYIGEQPGHPWREEGVCGFLIVGGPRDCYETVRALYQSCVESPLRYYHTSATAAELCKYMENCFLATKVAFVNQFFDIATAFGVEFPVLRQLWLADPRVGESHTNVTEERGFRGRCLPKDVAALLAAMKPLGGAPLLEAVLAYNSTVCERADRNLSTASTGSA